MGRLSYKWLQLSAISIPCGRQWVQTDPLVGGLAVSVGLGAGTADVAASDHQPVIVDDRDAGTLEYGEGHLQLFCICGHAVYVGRLRQVRDAREDLSVEGVE